MMAKSAASALHLQQNCRGGKSCHLTAVFCTTRSRELAQLCAAHTQPCSSHSAIILRPMMDTSESRNGKTHLSAGSLPAATTCMEMAPWLTFGCCWSPSLAVAAAHTLWDLQEAIACFLSDVPGCMRCCSACNRPWESRLCNS